MNIERLQPTEIILLRRIDLPPSVPAALFLAVGVWLSEVFSPSLSWTLSAAALSTGLSGMFRGCRQPRSSSMALLIAFLLLGMSLWTIRSPKHSVSNIQGLALPSGDTIVLTGQIRSIPATSIQKESSASHLTSTYGGLRTNFFLAVQSVSIDKTDYSVSGTLRVIVNGDAAAVAGWGDRVRIPGRLERDLMPRNPGEFDYQRFLERQSCCGVFFVRHSMAMEVKSRAGIFDPRRWLNVVRQRSVRIFNQHLDAGIRPLAEALLLGNRGHLDPSMERDFITSGTMHLLAISGLHVGILYLFLIRLFNVLLFSRRRAMLVALMCCIFYACLTDLRPSVLRAVGFISISVLAQIMNRHARMLHLVGGTTFFYVLFDPAVVFDLGAWLSFLAVSALGWVSVSDHSENINDAPPVPSLTWQERLKSIRAVLHTQLNLWHRQMAAVTLFSMPLVASQFHVLSLSGLFVNLILIPFSLLVMISGFVFLGAGLLAPFLCTIFGAVFGSLLSVMSFVVNAAAEIPGGSTAIPDLPEWFVPVYYVLVLAAISVRERIVTRCLWAGLAILVLCVLGSTVRRPQQEGLTVTVLSVGHGNAVVVETPDDRVLLFDAGALNQSERTAERIARFLWTRGHRMVDGVFLSHPDSDHYNAVPGLLERMPAGGLYIPSEMASSSDPAVIQMLDDAGRRRVPVQIVFDDDHIDLGAMMVRFHQAGNGGGLPMEDNEMSLVASLNCYGHQICIPGDLEGRGAEQLYPRISPADILISPHHGSLRSNTAETSRRFRPDLLLVSSRSTELTSELGDIFPSGTKILNTAAEGAITTHIAPDSAVTTETFLSTQMLQQNAD